MGAGASGLHDAAPPPNPLVQRGQENRVSRGVLGTPRSALTQAGMTETIGSGFPSLPSPVLLDYLG